MQLNTVISYNFLNYQCHKYIINKWIIINGYILLVLLCHINAAPTNNTLTSTIRPPRTNSIIPLRQLRQLFGETINIGPCKWIINKKCPDDDVRFYLYTRKNPADRQFVYIAETWEKSNLSTSNFDPAHPTKIIIHGYNADMFIHPLLQMKDEYFERGDYNLFFVDWSTLVPAPCYPSAARNVRHTGACIAQLIERILDSGTDDIHLIGFSLGAQVTNFAAKNLKSFKLPRITGLDPAMPLFIMASNENKLDATDADFVDIIHTNALVQGKIERCGHADFYMNGGVMQPGCWQNERNVFACSHHRAPDYFSESITSLRGFWGWPCNSYISYLLGFCRRTNNLVIAGEDCKPSTRGMYFLVTNDVSPFATGRWTDISGITKNVFGPTSTLSQGDPLQQQIDQWGKLDSDFNNIDIFPTPMSQDPNGDDWPYFDKNKKNLLDDTDKNDLVLTENDADIELPTTETIRKLEKNTEFVAKIKKLYQKRYQQKESSFEAYRKNLTNGIIAQETFQVPEVNLVTRNKEIT